MTHDEMLEIRKKYQEKVNALLQKFSNNRPQRDKRYSDTEIVFIALTEEIAATHFFNVFAVRADLDIFSFEREYADRFSECEKLYQEILCKQDSTSEEIKSVHHRDPVHDALLFDMMEPTQKSARKVSFDRDTKDELAGDYRYKGRRNISAASIQPVPIALSTKPDRNKCATPTPEGAIATEPVSIESLLSYYGGLFSPKQSDSDAAQKKVAREKRKTELRHNLR